MSSHLEIARTMTDLDLLGAVEWRRRMRAQLMAEALVYAGELEARELRRGESSPARVQVSSSGRAPGDAEQGKAGR